MADGTITFDTTLDNSRLEADLKSAEKAVADAEKRLAAAKAERTDLERQMDSAQRAMQSTADEIGRLEARIAELRDTDPGDAAAWARAHAEIETCSASLERMRAHEQELAKSGERLDERWAKANQKVREHQAALSAATKTAEGCAAQYGSAYSSASRQVQEGVDAASAAFERMAHRVGMMVRRVFVLAVATSALRSLRDMLSGALMENERLSASVAALQGAWQGVVNYVANAVAPAIAALVDFATKAITNLAGLVDRVFGTSIVKSIQEAQQAAQAAWRETDASKAAAKAAEKAAKSAGKQSKATKTLARETDRATRSLMAFDEINALSDSSSSGSDGAPDGTGGAGGIAGGVADALGAGDGLRPDWDALDVGKLSAKLSEIMLVLGAALMAVGAILAFSGINIPLGLTLMAIGALMVYTAYKEDWDELSRQTRDAITGALVLTGAVMLVIGAVLAFSGINIPLGIGLMAAGVTLLGVAAALNWETMGATLQGAVTACLVIAGATAVVLGAVLAFSGANVPLGIGLMAVGALALGISAALNWDALGASLREAIGGALQLVGTVALVVGAVLAFTAANIPLGIGLMAVGAAAMVGAAALQWDALGGQLSGVVSSALEVVGMVALVIGAVLAFSFVNVPLGVALMAAGAAAQFAAVALDWDSLKDKVGSVLATFLRLAGAVALAVGAVIAFSGVNLPLGIGLLAAGALALSTSAALSWDKLPAQVRTVVSAIAGVASAALLALGVVLCASGFALPIGIALIAAGAGGLVTAATMNWGLIKSKVAGVWSSLVSWWRSTVAPIFTVQWWANLFSSIASGLANAVSTAIGSFTSFVSSMAGGIGSLIGSIGGGFSFSLPSVSVPHLAQGAVIPPNREFMAVLGDQRSGTNVEAPEGLLRQVVREEAGQIIAEALLSMQGRGGDGDAIMVLNVDGEELARATSRGSASLARRGLLSPSLDLNLSAT